MNENQVIIYNNGEIELKVSVDNETVWLNRQQMAKLFDRDIKTIGKHINNVFKEKELDPSSTVAKFETVQIEGGRKIKRNIEYYNLDVIISVGYRVKSKRGVQFRQWATRVLKEYIYNGYAINREKITQLRITKLEKDVEYLKSKIKNNILDIKQGIFYDGQIFDAYKFINDLIKSAQTSIILIDNYIDESILTLFSKVSDIRVTIYTQSISKQLKLDYEKYNKQYNNVIIKTTKKFHDRFLIIDSEKTYHIGGSLKDLGKKVFAFSKIDIDTFDIILQMNNKNKP